MTKHKRKYNKKKLNPKLLLGSKDLMLGGNEIYITKKQNERFGLKSNQEIFAELSEGNIELTTITR